jgi:eukaryotic-like serine/threonine-protein kinase
MTVPPTEGVPLRKLLVQSKGSANRRRLLEPFLKVCMAIDYAHAKGVIHQAIDPDGIVVGDHGEVYLLDLQHAVYARPSGRAEENARREMAGSSGYEAPEQLAGMPTDARTDVYALGTVLFEILTGERLHASDDPYERARLTLTGASSAVASQRRPDVSIPSGLDAICVRATSPDPTFRFPSARRLHDAIIDVLEATEDLEAREGLAEQYAEQAEGDAVRALVAIDGGYAYRARALGSAARAFAIDPQSLGARRALRTLLSEEPVELPEDAKADLRGARIQAQRAVGRFTATAYGIFLVILGFVPTSGLKSGAGFFVLVLALAAAIGTSLRIARSAEPSRRLLLGLIVTSSLAIACASGLYGPFVLVPALVVANTLTLFVTLPDTLRRWGLAAGLMALLGPVALQKLGLSLPEWEATAQGVRYLPAIREFRELPVRVGLLLATVAAIVVPSLWLAHLADRRADTARRLTLASWQLRQLLPGAARDDVVESEAQAKARPL